MLTATPPVPAPAHIKTGHHLMSSHPHYRSQSVPAVEIDESFKRSLRKRVEYKLTHKFYDAQEKRDAALNAAAAQDDDEQRARAYRTFEERIEQLKVLAEEEYQALLRREIANRSGIERREEPLESVEQQQQRILDSFNLQRGDNDHITYPMRAPSAQGTREHGGARRPSFTNAPTPQHHPEIWRPPTAAPPEPSGIARTFAHAHAHAHTQRPPTAPPQMRRGSASGGISGQNGLSTASEHARAAAGRFTPNPVQQQQSEHWNRLNRPRAPSDALGRQSPAVPTTRAGAGPSTSVSSSAQQQQRWEYPRTSSRPIAARAPAHDGMTPFPSGGSPSSRPPYGSPSSPSEVRQGIAIPRSRFPTDDASRSASFGSSSLRNDASARWGTFRHDIVRESPESDEGEGEGEGEGDGAEGEGDEDEEEEEDEDGEDEDTSNGDFAHSLELGHSPEERRSSEERDRLLAVKLQREEVRAAKEEERKRKDIENQQEEFRRREEQYYRRAVERSADAGKNGHASPSSWAANHRASPGPSGSGSGKDERRKALLEQEMFPTTSAAGPSHSRQQTNAVAGPSGSRSGRSSSKADAEAMDRKITNIRTKVDECLEEMIVEMMDLRNKQLEDAGDDDGDRAKVMVSYTARMESVYGILEEFNTRLQRELRVKKQEIAMVMHGVQQNGAGIKIR